MKTLKRYEEAAGARIGEIKVSGYLLAKVTDVSFTVTIDKWQEIER